MIRRSPASLPRPRLSPRIVRLLTTAAHALTDGKDPLTKDWLDEHDVTSQEAEQIASIMATAILGYLRTT